MMSNLFQGCQMFYLLDLSMFFALLSTNNIFQCVGGYASLALSFHPISKQKHVLATHLES